MIDIAIAHVASQLNESLRNRFDVADNLVMVSNLVDAEGGPVPEVANKVAAFLVNVERETVTYRPQPTGGARAIVTAPPVALNLMVMFAANFSGSNYGEALKLLSGVVGYFQMRPVFDHHSSPGLDTRIERITLEIENLNTAELSNLWSILGGRYMPSILYRLRMVSIDEGQMTGRATPITQTHTHTQTQTQTQTQAAPK